jgi:nucleoside-diphosphate-sugar epimerase
MRVLVAGASGAIGLPVVRLLRRSGHEVIALHRSPEGRARLAGTGAITVQADLLDRDGLSQALAGQHADAVIAALAALTKTSLRHADMAAANRLRTEGTASLLAAACRLGALRLITASTVFGYGFGDWDDRVLTEAAPFAPPGRGRLEPSLAALRFSEQRVLGAERIGGIALRYGQFYGPGVSDALISALCRRRLPVTRSGGVLPWVYIDDAAAAIIAALELGEPGTAYNIADDEPVSMTAMLTAMADAVGAPQPRTVPRWLLAAAPFAKVIATTSLRVSSAKAKAELRWTPQAPTYREGLQLTADRHQPPATSRQPSATISSPGQQMTLGGRLGKRSPERHHQSGRGRAVNADEGEGQ